MVRLVDVPVDGGMVQPSVDPVDQVVGEQEEERYRQHEICIPVGVHSVVEF